jgi:hypothetical protein
MPLPWGRLFWSFVVGLTVGVVGYAIYRGDLRWELPSETALRAARSAESADVPDAPVLPAPPELAQKSQAEPAPTPSAVDPAPVEAPSAEAELEPLAEDERTAPAEQEPELPAVDASAEVPVAPTPEPKPDPAPVAAVEPEPEEPRFLIVPGVRVGDIVPSMTERQLQDRYGARNVTPIEVSLGEGFTEPGTALFASDPQRSLEILWTSQQPNRRPRLVRVKGRAWKTAEGIGLGTTLRQLEELNDGPFTLSGFGWTYSGAVVSWGNGKLGPLLQSRGRVQLWLEPPKNAKPGKLVGDKDFKSSNPAMRSLDPRVYALTVEFPSSEAAKR